MGTPMAYRLRSVTLLVFRVWALRIGNRLQDIKDHIDRNGEHLADAGSRKSAPRIPSFGEKADSQIGNDLR